MGKRFQIALEKTRVPSVAIKLWSPERNVTVVMMSRNVRNSVVILEYPKVLTISRKKKRDVNAPKTRNVRQVRGLAAIGTVNTLNHQSSKCVSWMTIVLMLLDVTVRVLSVLSPDTKRIMKLNAMMVRKCVKQGNVRRQSALSMD
jgi:hypothetical protein